MLQRQLNTVAAGFARILVEGAPIQIVGGDFIVNVYPKQGGLQVESVQQAAAYAKLHVYGGL